MFDSQLLCAAFQQQCVVLVRGMSMTLLAAWTKTLKFFLILNPWCKKTSCSACEKAPSAASRFLLTPRAHRKVWRYLSPGFRQWCKSWGMLKGQVLSRDYYITSCPANTFSPHFIVLKWIDYFEPLACKQFMCATELCANKSAHSLAPFQDRNQWSDW